MKLFTTLTLCIGVLSVTGATRAEIYETTGADGKPVFTDTPANTDADVVQLKETNVSDPTPVREAVEAPATPPAAPERQTQGSSFEDPNAELWEERVRRHNAIEKMKNSSSPHGVVGGESRKEVLEAEPRREVLNAEPRRETLDADAPHEVLEAETPREVGDTP